MADLREQPPQANAVPLQNMTARQIDESLDMLHKEKARRNQRENLAGAPTSLVTGAYQEAKDVESPKKMSARGVLANALDAQEKECLRRIGELQEMRKRLDRMYLCDVEAVLELCEKFRSF